MICTYQHKYINSPCVSILLNILHKGSRNEYDGGFVVEHHNPASNM